MNILWGKRAMILRGAEVGSGNGLAGNAGEVVVTPKAGEVVKDAVKTEVVAETPEAKAAAAAKLEAEKNMTPEQKVAAEKVATEARAKALTDARAANAPKEYADFQRDKSIQVDAEMMKEVVPALQKLGLNQAEAQGVLALYDKAVIRNAQAQDAAYAKIVGGWKEAQAADKEFGGAELEKNKALSLHALKKVGGDELIQAFELAGLTENPAIIRAGFRLGKRMGDDSFDFGKGGQSGADALDKLFPSHKQQ